MTASGASAKSAWGSIYHHKRQNSTCKECGGSSICEHNRQKSHCKEYLGPGICPHKLQNRRCRECGESSICGHDRQRSYCKDCRRSALIDVKVFTMAIRGPPHSSILFGASACDVWAWDLGFDRGWVRVVAQDKQNLRATMTPQIYSFNKTTHHRNAPSPKQRSSLRRKQAVTMRPRGSEYVDRGWVVAGVFPAHALKGEIHC